MRIVVSLLLVFAASTSNAAAEAPTESATIEVPFRFALAVNGPLLWTDATSVGFSGYVAVSDHQSVRLNLATYKEMSLITALAGGEYERSGRLTDVAVGWQYFARRVWDGFSLELGLMRRAQDIDAWDDNTSPDWSVHTKTTGYAARGMIGWSWLGWNRVFLAAAVGASFGRYTGTETVTPDSFDPMSVTTKVTRNDVAAEAYLRFGVAFGL